MGGVLMQPFQSTSLLPMMHCISGKLRLNWIFMDVFKTFTIECVLRVIIFLKVDRNYLEISKITAHVFMQMTFDYMNIQLGHTHTSITGKFQFLLVFFSAASD